MIWNQGAPEDAALPRAKLAITGVAQAWHDVAHFVESFVDRGEMDRYIRMRRRQPFDTFRCSDQAQEFDARSTPLFEHVDGRDCRATCGQHRIEDQAQIDI